VSGPARPEYAFTPDLRRYLVGGAAAGLVVAGLAVFGVLVLDRSLQRYVWPALVVVAALAWTVARNLVLTATLQDGRLRVRTLLGGHDIAVDDITSLDWNVARGRLGSANPLNAVTARIRAGLFRTLRVPMPAGARLVRDLEAARSAGGPGAGPDPGEAHEFEFTRMDTLWKQGAVVEHATLDDEFLRAPTVDGREHVVRIADIREVDSSLAKGPEAVVRHPGGNLHIPMPSGAELVHRLAATDS
jgi:hypothetical protein